MLETDRSKGKKPEGLFLTVCMEMPNTPFTCDKLYANLTLLSLYPSTLWMSIDICLLLYASSLKALTYKPMIKSTIIDRYSEQILELINSHEELTRSDLQGIVDAILINVVTDVENKARSK